MTFINVRYSTCECSIGRDKWLRMPSYHVAALLIWVEKNVCRTEVEGEDTETGRNCCQERAWDDAFAIDADVFTWFELLYLLNVMWCKATVLCGDESCLSNTAKIHSVCCSTTEKSWSMTQVHSNTYIYLFNIYLTFLFYIDWKFFFERQLSLASPFEMSCPWCHVKIKMLGSSCNRSFSVESRNTLYKIRHIIRRLVKTIAVQGYSSLL